MTNAEIYDLVIIGAGPAGLAGGLYAARDGYRTVLLEKNPMPGGQIMLTERIENYPGWETISGFDLVQNMRTQVEKFGATIASSQPVVALSRRADGIIEVVTDDGEKKTWLARAVILAPGSDYRRLGAPGEDALRQATKVSYCATCDGAFYRGKDILCVGGGNTAVEDTIYLAKRFARKVTLVHRRTEFRAQKVLVEELHELAKEKGIDIKTPCVVDAIVPTPDGAAIDHVKVRNVDTGAIEQVKVDGVFIFVGMDPNTGWLRGFVEINEAGYIAADPITMKTATPGVFVAGDCRQNAPLQLATACADGVTAAMQLKEFFRNPGAWSKNAEENGGEKGW